MTRSSSWISDILYRNGYLALILTRESAHDEPVALLYGRYGDKGEAIPPYMSGLLQMYRKRDAATGNVTNSTGTAYNRLIKHAKGADGNSKYVYQRIEGSFKVAELKRLMTGG